MSRLSERDKRRADEAAEALRAFSQGPGSAAERALLVLKELLGTENIAAYEAVPDDGGARVAWHAARGMPARDNDFRHHLSAFFERASAGLSHFDANLVQVKQRNRAVTLPLQKWCKGKEPEQIAHEMTAYAPSLGLPKERLTEVATTSWTLDQGLGRLGIHDADHQLRLVLCDGPKMLGLFASMQEMNFEERQRLLLQRVAPVLREQLLAEARVGGLALGDAAALEALEHISSAAFFLDDTGRVAHANAIGKARLDEEDGALRNALAEAVRGVSLPNGVLLTRLPGFTPPVYLACVRAAGDRLRLGQERARARWGLSPRETEILGPIAAGLSNREIAHRLAASERTVELHVSSVLRKACADSRSQLVFDLWRLAEAP